MKILDLAILKEELNGCRTRLSEVISRMQESALNTQSHTHLDCKSDTTAFGRSSNESTTAVAEFASTSLCATTANTTDLAGFIESLNEICGDTSSVVSQLDGYFATFTEESGCFNQTSAKLQSEVARVNESFICQK
jgi:hypothetical protein